MLLLWDASVETNFPVVTHLSAMSWLFISSQTGLMLVKAFISNMKHVSEWVCVY